MDVTPLSAIASAFAPDTATASADAAALSPTAAVAPSGGDGNQPSFKDTVKAILSDVNDKLAASDAASRDFASGRTNDLQKVTASVEEANLALNFTMAMRSKLLEAYQEISRMQV